MLRLERPEHAARKYASYRLGRNDAGLIIPRAEAARILGIACDETLIALQTDQWQVSKELQSHGSCRFTYNGTPFEGLVTRRVRSTRTRRSNPGAATSRRATSEPSFPASPQPPAARHRRARFAPRSVPSGIRASCASITYRGLPGTVSAPRPPAPYPRRVSPAEFSSMKFSSNSVRWRDDY